MSPQRVRTLVSLPKEEFRHSIVPKTTSIPANGGTNTTCNVEIDRLQRDLFKTQEDLRRSESTIDAQLEIEAKMIEEKAD